MDALLLKKIDDERAIRILLTDYCLALDIMDLTAVANIFTEDCVVKFGPDERLNSQGRKQVAKSLERMWRWSRTSHHLSNVKIKFEGEDCAFSTSYVLAWHEKPNKKTATIYGQYHDELVRKINGWQIRRRTMYMNGNNAEFTVGIYPFERAEPPEGWTPQSID